MEILEVQTMNDSGMLHVVITVALENGEECRVYDGNFSHNHLTLASAAKTVVTSLNESEGSRQYNVTVTLYGHPDDIIYRGVLTTHKAARVVLDLLGIALRKKPDSITRSSGPGWLSCDGTQYKPPK